MSGILVTGSRGYVGSVLVPLLNKCGYRIREYDLLLGNNILDGEEILEASKECRIIIHLAAVVGIHAAEQDLMQSERINVVGTENVLKCNKRVIFTSVLAGYDTGVVSEETPVVPRHPYYKQKLKAEELVLGGPENVVLRFGTLFGVSPRMRRDLFIHERIVEALEGKIVLYQPEYIRPITDIQDAVRAICFFLTSNSYGGIYNVVSTNLTKHQICEEIKCAIPCELEVVKSVDIEKRNYSVSTSRLRSLGFIFRPNLNKAIRDLAGVMEVR